MLFYRDHVNDSEKCSDHYESRHDAEFIQWILPCGQLNSGKPILKRVESNGLSVPIVVFGLSEQYIAPSVLARSRA